MRGAYCMGHGIWMSAASPSGKTVFKKKGQTFLQVSLNCSDPTSWQRGSIVICLLLGTITNIIDYINNNIYLVFNFIVVLLSFVHAGIYRKPVTRRMTKMRTEVELERKVNMKLSGEGKTKRFYYVDINHWYIYLDQLTVSVLVQSMYRQKISF